MSFCVSFHFNFAAIKVASKQTCLQHSAAQADEHFLGKLEVGLNLQVGGQESRLKLFYKRGNKYRKRNGKIKESLTFQQFPEFVFVEYIVMRL